MATPATSLLADFDFNLTPEPPLVPHSPFPPRPPTPDPRRTPTPHPPRHLHRSFPTLTATDDDRRRLRKKPTAIFVGHLTKSPSPPDWPCADDAETFAGLRHYSHHTLPSLLPLLSSTPSPHYATSPSLSSGGTTIQSSPTVTPTSAYFASSFDEPPRGLAFRGTLDSNEGEYGLRRAKRLPHREQGLWEVHAVVQVSESSSGGGGSGSGGSGTKAKRQHLAHYDWCIQQQRRAGILASDSPQNPTFSTTTERSSAQVRLPVGRDTPNRDVRPKGFHGVPPESTTQKPHEVEPSSYTLSKYHFPAPPGDYRIGLSGDLQHPAKIHYRGASFDLVNPHASLLLSSSQVETPAEIDGLLDDYFEDPDAMPRAFYTDPETARRDIMGLGEEGENAGAATSSHESSATSLVPSRVASDPFDLRITDVPCQAAQPGHSSAAGASTIDDIVDEYDYTRDGQYEHEETLRALESGSPASHSENVFSQLAPEIQQHMSQELFDQVSEPPTSERTYGDTNQLLGLNSRRAMVTSAISKPLNNGSGARIKSAPRYSATETTITAPRPRSATASLHSTGSPFDSPASLSAERVRRGPHMDPGDREYSEHTFRSNGDGDWETERSESRAELPQGGPRPSQDSYANTSTFDEDNRWSAAPLASVQTYRPYGAGNIPADTPTNDDDFSRARERLADRYRENAVARSIRSDVQEQAAIAMAYRNDPQSIEDLRAYRNAALERAHNSDIELERIRKRNPLAVRRAAEEVARDTEVDARAVPPRRNMLAQRYHDFLGIFSGRHAFIGHSFRLANEAIAEANAEVQDDDDRNLLAPTPTRDDLSSRLEFNESANTFRTVRDFGNTPTGSVNHSRSGLDLGERPSYPDFPALPNFPALSTLPDLPDLTALPTLPILPATTYSPETHRGRPATHAFEPRVRDCGTAPQSHGKAPQRSNRRPAMSSQTSLRNLITSGSPTSNIQGAFTDQEMIQAAGRWASRPALQTHDPRVHGRNASSPFPRFQDTRPVLNLNPQGRWLVAPSELLSPQLQIQQERFSKRFLMRMLACPPMCVMYHYGHYDYLIAKKTDGRVKVMSASKKEDALAWAVLVSILYAFIIVGIITAVAITVQI